MLGALSRVCSAGGGRAAGRAPRLQEQPAWPAATVLLVAYVVLGCGVSCAVQLYLGSLPDVQSTSDLELKSTGLNAPLKTPLKLVLFLRSRAGAAVQRSWQLPPLLFPSGGLGVQPL